MTKEQITKIILEEEDEDMLYQFANLLKNICDHNSGCIQNCPFCTLCHTLNYDIVDGFCNLWNNRNNNIIVTR